MVFIPGSHFPELFLPNTNPTSTSAAASEGGSDVTARNGGVMKKNKEENFEFPPFSSLPLDPNGPRGNAWGLYPLSSPSSTFSSSSQPSKDTKTTKGTETTETTQKDQLGSLNLLTPTTTLAAAQEIIHGTRICTDWELTKPKTACFGRRTFEHRVISKAPRTVNDDVVEFNTQSGSQWDGFRHFGYQDHKVFYNGCTQHDVENSLRNGIHVWVENGGIVGRGVLLDYPRYAQAHNISFNPLETHKITISDLEAIIAFQNLPPFQIGDIFFLYTGFIDALETLSEADATRYATTVPPPAIGISASPETLEWFWDKHFAAVATDCPAFEALPFQSNTHWIHEWFLAGWGTPIGELFDLRRLSAACAETKKWSFWFSSVPLNVPGGVASPPNGVAVL